MARDRLDAAKRLGNPHAAFTIRTNEGLARLPLNELDEAASAFSDAPAVCRDAGAEDLVDETLLGLAAVAASRGDFDRAARLAAVALGHQTAERNVAEDTVWSQLVEIVALARGRFAPRPPATLAAVPGSA